jgi:hypothetical protein
MQLLAHDLECIGKRRQRHRRGSLLVIVPDWDVHNRSQLFEYSKAFWLGDIL